MSDKKKTAESEPEDGEIVTETDTEISVTSRQNTKDKLPLKSSGQNEKAHDNCVVENNEFFESDTKKSESNSRPSNKGLQWSYCTAEMDKSRERNASKT